MEDADRYYVERRVSGQGTEVVEVGWSWEQARTDLIAELQDRADEPRNLAVVRAAYANAAQAVERTWPEDEHPEVETDEPGKVVAWLIEVNGAITYAIRLVPAIEHEQAVAAVERPAFHDALDAVRRLADAGDPSAVVLLHLYEKDEL